MSSRSLRRRSSRLLAALFLTVSISSVASPGSADLPGAPLPPILDPHEVDRIQSYPPRAHTAWCESGRSNDQFTLNVVGFNATSLHVWTSWAGFVEGTAYRHPLSGIVEARAELPKPKQTGFLAFYLVNDSGLISTRYGDWVTEGGDCF